MNKTMGKLHPAAAMRLAAVAFITIFLMSAASAEVVADEDFQRADGQSASSGNWHALSGNGSEDVRNAASSVRHGSRVSGAASAHASELAEADVQTFDDQQAPAEDWQSPSSVTSATPKAASQTPQPPVLAQRTQAVATPVAVNPGTRPTSSTEFESTQALTAAAAPNAVVPTAGDPATAKQVFSLVAGESLESQIMKWAQRAGWKVLWNLPDDNNWIVPGDEVCGTDFEAAVNHVIEELASNGADVVADSWRGNHTIVMTQSGATE